MVWPMQLLPLLTTAHALFLDFDGTLTELAPRPEAVRVASGLVPTLAALYTRLGGALAIVTGRPEVDIDGFLAPLRLPLASEHGAQYRLTDTSLPAVHAPDLEPVLQAACALAERHPGLLVERKRASSEEARTSIDVSIAGADVDGSVLAASLDRVKHRVITACGSRATLEVLRHAPMKATLRLTLIDQPQGDET